MAVVGIDLGTTYSSVGIWKNGREQLFRNKRRQDAMESVIFVKESKEDTLFAAAAWEKCDTHPERTLFDSKRMLGMRYSDPEIQDLVQRLPFSVVGDKNDHVFIEVPESKVGTKTYPAIKLEPWEVSAQVLRHLRTLAKDSVLLEDGEDIKDCVITVPANFSDSQKAETRKAAKAAGLNVIRLVTEPTAAAIAYGMDNNSKKETKLLVFDFGGGTLDISILFIQDHTFIVKSTAGDVHLGGRDIDNLLMEYIIKREKLEAHRENKKFMTELRKACTQAKILLSDNDEASIYTHECSCQITREEFLEVCEPIFNRLLNPVKQALEHAKLKPSDIDDVIKVGGSTHIPKVTEILEGFFEKKRVHSTTDPQTSVVIGAAILAAKSSSVVEEGVQNLHVEEICPMNIGLRCVGDIMSTLIPAGSPFGTTVEQDYHTAYDDQQELPIDIFEGNSPLTKYNRLLASFTLHNIPKGRMGNITITVTFKLDENGILHASAKCGSSSASTKLTKDRFKYSSDDLKTISDRSGHEEADKAEADRRAAWYYLCMLNKKVVDYVTYHKQLIDRVYCSGYAQEIIHKASRELASLSTPGAPQEVPVEEYYGRLAYYRESLRGFYNHPYYQKGQPDFLK